jgi:Mycoplasma protein of unknown function, DUF285
MIVALVTNFNNDLRLWNVSSVVNMKYMFLNCFSFQGRGLYAWDTSKVQSMEGMFLNTPSFNGDLSLWNVSRVVSMNWQFRQATSFNGDLSRWDVRNLTDMEQMVIDFEGLYFCIAGISLTLVFPVSSCTQCRSIQI